MCKYIWYLFWSVDQQSDAERVVGFIGSLWVCDVNICVSSFNVVLLLLLVAKEINNNNNNNPIYKAPKALASEALAAGQSWVLLKSLVKEVRLKPRFKDAFKSIDLRHFCLVVINTFRLQSFQLTLSLCVYP